MANKICIVFAAYLCSMQLLNFCKHCKKQAQISLHAVKEKMLWQIFYALDHSIQFASLTEYY